MPLCTGQETWCMHSSITLTVHWPQAGTVLCCCLTDRPVFLRGEDELAGM